MNNNFFFEWIKHFIQHSKPIKDKKVSLILDGHKSHTQSIQALEFAAKSGDIMLSLPRHTSHWLQPLDVAFFKPFKIYFFLQINQWMQANFGMPVRMTQMCLLFELAYGRAASVSCAVTGFRKCGIFPVNMLVFDDADFAFVEVTDQLNSEESVSPVGVAAATSLSVDTSTYQMKLCGLNQS